MKRIATTFIVAGSLAFAAHAADIYRWTDESGKTHLSDTVPDKYKANALRIDPKIFEPTPEQRSEAQALAARQKDLAAAADASAAGRLATEAAQGGPAPTLSGPAPASSPSAADCENLQREYRESQECFAPFINDNGTLKPGAFRTCRRPVVDPTLKCGSPKAY
jgi:hypothetical protein